MINWEGRGTFRRIKKQNNFCVVMWKRQDYLIPGLADPLWNGVCRCSDTQGGLKQPLKIAKSYWISQHLQYSFFTYRFLLKTRVSLALGNSHLHFPRLHRKDLGDNWRASHPKSLPRPWFFREPGCIQGPAPEWQRSQMNLNSMRTLNSNLQKCGFFLLMPFKNTTGYSLPPSILGHYLSLISLPSRRIINQNINYWTAKKQKTKNNYWTVQNVQMLKKNVQMLLRAVRLFLCFLGWW